MTVLRELGTDMGKYIPAQIVPGIVGFISLPILTRLFLPLDYGYYSLVIAAVSVPTVIVGWLSMAVVRFYSVYDREGRLPALYGSMVRLLLITVAAIVAACSIILLLLQDTIDSRLYGYFWIGLLLLSLSGAYQLCLHFLRARRWVGWYSVFVSWQSVMTLLVGLSLIYIGNMDISSFFWGAAAAICVALPLAYMKSSDGVKVSGYLTRSQTREMVRYAFPLVVGNLAGWVLGLSDRYVIEAFHSSSEVGLYSLGYNVASQSMMLIVTLFMAATGPLGIKLYESEGRESAARFVAQSTRLYLLLALPASVCLGVLARPIIAIISPDQYDQAYTVLPWVAAGVFLLGMQQRFQAGLLYTKRTYYITAATVTAGLVNVGLNVIFVPEYGFLAAAVTTFVGYALLLAAIIAVSLPVFRWSFPVATLIRTVISSALMGLCVHFIYQIQPAAWFLAVATGAGAAVYFLVLAMLGEFTYWEIKGQNK